MVATGQNYRGSLAHDRDAWIGRVARFLPVGFYYKTFYRPKGSWKYWERYIRAKAGIGRLSRDTPHGYFDKDYCSATWRWSAAGRRGWPPPRPLCSPGPR